MRDRVALITGAGAGIGRAIAVRLARAGAAVVLADIDPIGAGETVRQIEIGGGRAAFIRTDVAVEVDVQAMITLEQAQLWFPPPAVLIQPEQIAEAVVMFVENEGLAGQVMVWPDGEPWRFL